MMRYAYFGNGDPATALHKLCAMQSGIVAFDIETVSIENATPLGAGFCCDPSEALYFNFDSPEFPWPLLRNPAVTKLVHNGKFDLRVIQKYYGTAIAPIIDTIIAAHLLGLPASLHDLSSVLFGVDLTTIEQLLGKRGKGQLTMRDIEPRLVMEKGAQDALYTLRAWLELKGRLPTEAYALEMDILPIIMRIEDTGMRVNLETLLKHKERLERELRFYRGIARGSGFNPRSSKQVAAIMQSRGHSVYYDKHTGNPIMDKEALNTIYRDDPMAQLTLLHRQNATLLSNFIDPTLQKHIGTDGRIHGNITQTIVSTGRFSRTRPNLQNIPDTLRDIFEPESGYYYEARDLSQIELRVLAYHVWQWTGDHSMMRVYDEGGDLHTEVVNEFHIPRRVAKVVNFGGMAYRGGAYTIWEKTGLPIEQGERIIAAYHKRFPGFTVYGRMHDEFVEKNGYAQTLMGRRRYFPELHSADRFQRPKILREAFNMPIQGTAGEILKRFMVRAATLPQCNTIHDEILFEPEIGVTLPGAELCDELAPFRTPMSRKVGANWKDMVEITVP